MEPTNYMTGHLPSELTNLRTDESEAVCLWSASSAQREELLGATQEGCQDDHGEDGLLCGKECVPYRDWCSRGTQVSPHWSPASPGATAVRVSAPGAWDLQGLLPVEEQGVPRGHL